MARRYIGDATVELFYRDRGDYAGRITVRDSNNKRLTWHFEDLRAPAVGHGAGIAYDSPEAYDRMAESAVSFGSNYTTDNRPDDDPAALEGYPDAETADAIEDATSWVLRDDGSYMVHRTRPRESYQCIDPNCPDAKEMPYHDHPEETGRHK